MVTNTKLVPVLCSVTLVLALVIAPFDFAFNGSFIQLHQQAAWAKDGGGANNGKGGDNSGNSGNNSGKGSGNNGNSGNSSGKGDGNNGNGKGKGGDQGGAKGTGGKSAGTGAKGATPSGMTDRSPASIPSNGVDAGRIGVEVHHPNGMVERIKGGRYIMEDAKGRTIINRSATVSDESRLESLTR